VNSLTLTLRKTGLTLARSAIVAIGIAVLSASPQAQAKYASIIIDADTGEVLQEVNADSQNYPASLTKMMTLYLIFEALDNGQHILVGAYGETLVIDWGLAKDMAEVEQPSAGRIYVGALYDYPVYRVGVFRSDDDGRKRPVCGFEKHVLQRGAHLDDLHVAAIICVVPFEFQQGG